MGEFGYSVPGIPTELTREGTIERIKRYIAFELRYYRSEHGVYILRVNVEMDSARPPFHCRLEFFPSNKRLALCVVDWEHMDTEQSAIALLGAIESLLQWHAEELASG